jgi:hypothetical protein
MRFAVGGIGDKVSSLSHQHFSLAFVKREISPLLAKKGPERSMEEWV